MHYQFNEGAFALFPAAWQDTTMNILRDEASGLAWVVSRGVISEGSDAEKSSSVSGTHCGVRWAISSRLNLYV